MWLPACLCTNGCAVAVTRTVAAQVRYEVDGSMTVFVQGPHGQVEAGSTRLSSECVKLAAAAARAAWGDTDLDLDVQHGRPVWLRDGDIVRIRTERLDLQEDPTGNPIGQVVWIMPVGGVMLVRPVSGSGIFPPEALQVVPTDTIDAEVVQLLARQAGRPANGRER